MDVDGALIHPDRAARCAALLTRLGGAALLLLATACSTLPAAPTAGVPTAPPASTVNDPAPSPDRSAAPTPAAGDATAMQAVPAPAPAAPAAPAAALAAAGRAPQPAPAAGADPLAQLIEQQAAAQIAATAAAVEQIDVWERIRRGFAIPDLETRLADDRTRWYAGQPDYLDRMAQRASRYLFHIVEEIEKRGMPTELALLPFVESAMQPEAVSSAKAAGLWQFIPSTGKLYSLEQNLWHDKRRDVVESTRAALDYLQKLYGDFGDWHLALAAYNWGEGAVGRAIARNQAQRRPTDYASLKMPRETQYYVPKLQAIKNIVRDPARYGITLPEIRNEPYFVAVTKERDIDVETAARLAEMPVADFVALNPGFNRPVIIGAAQSSLLLPADRAETFRANLAAYVATGQPLASWTTYALQRGETLAEVAKRAEIGESKLREANRIPPRYRLAPGSVILIPRDESMDDDIAPEYLEASFSLLPEAGNLRQITYKVRRGDTLQSVARRWKVRPEEVVAWNHLRSQKLFAGQRLTLTVARTAAPTRAAKAKRATGASAATQAKARSVRPAAKPAAAPAAVKPARSGTLQPRGKPAAGKPATSKKSPNATRGATAAAAAAGAGLPR